jgi:hypothetical protein
MSFLIESLCSGSTQNPGNHIMKYIYVDADANVNADADVDADADGFATTFLINVVFHN